MEFNNATEALSKALAETSAGFAEVESMHRAELDASHLTALLREPKAAAKALGLKVSDDSQVHVTVKGRAQRDPRAAALARLIIIIIIKWRNCDTDIIIFY